MTYNVLLPLLASLTCAPSAPGQPTPEDIEGLWLCRIDYVAEPQGTITLSRENNGWFVTGPHGDRALAETQRDGTHIASFGDVGAVRFEPPPDRSHATVFWIQPPSPMLSQSYATPVRCPPDADGSWSGVVTTLDDRTDFFCGIDQSSNGAINFVEHTLNFGRFWNVTGLSPSPDGGLIFEGPEPAVTGKLSADGALVLDSEQMEPLTFRRLDAEAAVGYVPGSPGTNAVSPRPFGDGWRTATLSDAGLDSDTIGALLGTLADPTRRAHAATRVHSVQIARAGSLAVDAYFFGHGPEDTHDTRSAGKSVASLLVGAALSPNATDKLAVALSESLDRATGADASKATLGDLLAMRTGLWLDDGDPECPAAEDRVQESDEQDWYRPALQATRNHPRDTRFAYSSLSINLAGAVLAENTDRWIPALLDQQLLQPLDVSACHINLMPSGDAYFGGGIRLRPRDLLKIGQLVLDGGRWNGRQVVPESWIDATTTPRSKVRPDFHYAAGWWCRTYTVEGRRIDTIQALGNGGQTVVAIPELQLAACFTAGNYGDGRAASQITEELIPDFVIRAALRSDRSLGPQAP
ncbi:MAG: serine hydrolase [Planctomycetota bacterium]